MFWIIIAVLVVLPFIISAVATCSCLMDISGGFTFMIWSGGSFMVSWGMVVGMLVNKYFF